MRPRPERVRMRPRPKNFFEAEARHSMKTKILAFRT